MDRTGDHTGTSLCCGSVTRKCADDKARAQELPRRAAGGHDLDAGAFAIRSGGVVTLVLWVSFDAEGVLGLDGRAQSAAEANAAAGRASLGTPRWPLFAPRARHVSMQAHCAPTVTTSFDDASSICQIRCCAVAGSDTGTDPEAEGDAMVVDTPAPVGPLTVRALFRKQPPLERPPVAGATAATAMSGASQAANVARMSAATAGTGAVGPSAAASQATAAAHSVADPAGRHVPGCRTIPCVRTAFMHHSLDQMSSVVLRERRPDAARRVESFALSLTMFFLYHR